MTQPSHPLRDIPIAVYQRISGENGPEFIAKFVPYSAYPIFFSGADALDTEKRARAFAEDAVARHEVRYQNRCAAMDRARTAKASKKAAQVSP